MAPSQDYIAPLDGLRALSVLLVVLGHFGLARWVPGTLGLTVFFFLSGFLITRQLLAEQAQTGGIALGRFFLRRLLRLWPVLLVVVPAAAVVNLLAGGSLTLGQVLAGLFYFTNYLAMAQPYHTGPGGMDSPLVVLWSLAVEQHFYLLHPFLLLALPGRRQLALGMAGLILAATLWRYGLAAECVALQDGCAAGTEAFRIAFATEMRLDSILYGALLAALLGSGAAPGLLRLFQSHLTLAAALALLLASLLLRDPLFRAWLRYSVQGAGLFLGFGCLLYGRRLGLARRWLSARPAALLGRWSYSLYVWHLVVLVAAVPLLPPALWQPAILETRPGAPWLLGVLPLLLAASVLLAALSYRVIERPVLRLRRPLRTRPLRTRPSHRPPRRPA